MIPFDECDAHTVALRIHLVKHKIKETLSLLKSFRESDTIDI